MISEGFTRRGALLVGAGAAAACTQDIETPAYTGALEFKHGIASGDPKNDKVIIWTRVTPEQQGPVPVRWIVARNRELTDIVKTGVVQATDARDYTVKVDVTGLRAGAPYFYGFRAGDRSSATGKTKTLPRGALSQLKLAVVSCASFPHGFFNVYEAIGRRDDVDLVVHLGDYIYEYGLSGYGGETATALGRIPSPEVECIRLSDYRLRHAQAKGEAELQAAHAAAPWVVVWDDHEVANDSWSGGAENHTPETEGPWAERKRAALQAYYEWMPIREPEAGRAFEAINRSFQFGDLVSLVMLETRLLARTHQFDPAQMPIKRQRWDMSNAAAPVAIRDGEPDKAGQQLLPAIYESVNGAMQPVLDWQRAHTLAPQAAHLPDGFYVAPDLDALSQQLDAPERVLLGPAQEDWLKNELTTSKRDGVKWRVIGNQVLMAPITAPDLSAAPAPLAAALERLRPGVTQLLKLTKFPFPLSTDGWDGYPRARERVLAAIRAAGGDTLVITGDSHSAWANELTDPTGRVAVEFGGTSVTSPSDGYYFTNAGLNFEAALLARNPDVKWTDHEHHGYIVLTLTKEQALAEYMTVSTITAKQYDTARAAAFTVAPAGNGSVGPLTPLAG